MALVDRLDRLQRNHPSLGFPIAVIYKYFDDFGPYLAALITYYAFVSLFPLLLLATTILGYVLAGDPQLQQRILDSALNSIPVVGADLRSNHKIGGGVTGLVVGSVVALYGGLGVAQAVQYAMNTAWGVPRNVRPNPFKARGRSLLLLAVTGLGIVGTSALAIFGTGTAGSLGTALRVLVLAGSVLVNAALFVFTFRVAVARDLRVRDVAPGAVLAAVVWQTLQSVGADLVSRIVQRAGATNGVFAVVLGLLAFLYVAATAVILCVEINVVRVGKLHPRALLTPFTDAVDLTPGDRRSYTRAAKAQRSKGFETVSVTFDDPPAAPEADGARADP